MAFCKSTDLFSVKEKVGILDAMLLLEIDINNINDWLPDTI